MADINAWDNIEAFQLKECYDLAAQCVKIDVARDVLRDRSRKIDLPPNYVPMHSDMSLPDSSMQVLTQAVRSLAMEGFAVSDGSRVGDYYKVHSLPDSAEKAFVQALLALREGTNETQRLQALNRLSVALSFSHNDPRYIALVEILNSAGVG